MSPGTNERGIDSAHGRCWAVTMDQCGASGEGVYVSSSNARLQRLCADLI